MPITIDNSPNPLLAGEIARLSGQGQYEQKQERFHAQLQQFEQQMALREAQIAEQRRAGDLNRNLAYYQNASRNQLARDTQANQIAAGFQRDAQGFDRQKELNANQFERQRALAEGQFEQQTNMAEMQNEAAMERQDAAASDRWDLQMDLQQDLDERRQVQLRDQRRHASGLAEWQEIQDEFKNGGFQSERQYNDLVGKWGNKYGDIFPDGPPGTPNKRFRTPSQGIPGYVSEAITDKDGMRVPGLSPEMVGHIDNTGEFVWDMDRRDVAQIVNTHESEKLRARTVTQQNRTKQADAVRKQFDAGRSKIHSDIMRRVEKLMEPTKDEIGQQVDGMSQGEALKLAVKEGKHFALATGNLQELEPRGGRKVYVVRDLSYILYIEPGSIVKLPDGTEQERD